MQLINTAQRQKLLENGRAQRAALDEKQGAIDFEPAVKIFTPDGNATWLLTEPDPNGHLAFGLCGPRPRRAGTRLREPARARRRPRLARATPRARSLLRAHANDRGLRRSRSRAS